MGRLVAIVACATFVAVGCSSGGEQLTVEEYFAQLETISIEFDEAVPDIDFNDLDAVQAGFRTGRDANKDFVSALKSLSPPDELSDLHDQTVSDGEAALDDLNEFVDRVLDAGSVDELESIFTDIDALSASSDTFTDRCLDLEEAASGAGIEIELRCG